MQTVCRGAVRVRALSLPLVGLVDLHAALVAGREVVSVEVVIALHMGCVPSAPVAAKVLSFRRHVRVCGSVCCCSLLLSLCSFAHRVRSLSSLFRYVSNALRARRTVMRWVMRISGLSRSCSRSCSLSSCFVSLSLSLMFNCPMFSCFLLFVFHMQQCCYTLYSNFWLGVGQLG